MTKSERSHVAHYENDITSDGHVPVKAVLEAALASDLNPCLVIGIDRGGNFYAGATDNGEVCKKLVTDFLKKLETGF